MFITCFQTTTFDASVKQDGSIIEHALTKRAFGRGYFIMPTIKVLGFNKFVCYLVSIRHNGERSPICMGSVIETCWRDTLSTVEFEIACWTEAWRSLDWYFYVIKVWEWWSDS